MEVTRRKAATPLLAMVDPLAVLEELLPVEQALTLVVTVQAEQLAVAELLAARPVEQVLLVVRAERPVAV